MIITSLPLLLLGLSLNITSTHSTPFEDYYIATQVQASGNPVIRQPVGHEGSYAFGYEGNVIDNLYMNSHKQYLLFRTEDIADYITTHPHENQFFEVANFGFTDFTTEVDTTYNDIISVYCRVVWDNTTSSVLTDTFTLSFNYQANSLSSFNISPSFQLIIDNAFKGIDSGIWYNHGSDTIYSGLFSTKNDNNMPTGNLFNCDVIAHAGMQVEDLTANFSWFRMGITCRAVAVGYQSFMSESGEYSIYQAGYEAGLSNASSDSALQESWYEGYYAGIDYAQQSDSAFVSSISSILQIGLLPVNIFLTLLDMEVFGINIGAFVSSLIMVVLIIILFKAIFGGSNKGGS